MALGAARHVLAGIVLQRKDGALSADLRDLECDGVFNPQNDSATISAQLRESLCIDEGFSELVERLRVEDLKEIGRRNGIKVG